FLLFFFFFQAEDGIRDKLVTGVQTCALPISNTTTFCKPPSGLATTSSALTPPGWTLEQLGSAFMLMCAGVGRGPANFTSPFTTAVPGAGPSLAGVRPRAGSRPAATRTAIAATSRARAFAFMPHELLFV